MEFEPFPAPAVSCDAVALAGDVDVGERGLDWILASFPDLPVIYVLGNHEYYEHTAPGLREELQARTAGTSVHLLEDSAVRIGGVTFLGCTLWTDFRLTGDPDLNRLAAARGMVDYRVIRVSPHGTRLRPSDTERWHRRSRAWLEEELSKAREVEGDTPVVVVTHHAPSPRSIHPVFRGDPLNPAFASDLDSVVATGGARLWVHGHTHRAMRYRLGETEVLGNPRGYPTERGTGFDPELVVEI